MAWKEERLILENSRKWNKKFAEGKYDWEKKVSEVDVSSKPSYFKDIDALIR